MWPKKHCEYVNRNKVNVTFCDALSNRQYAHFITRAKNYQLSVDGTTLDGDLKVEVTYKSMESKYSLNNNSPLKLRVGPLTYHIRTSFHAKEVYGKRDGLSIA